MLSFLLAHAKVGDATIVDDPLKSGREIGEISYVLMLQDLPVLTTALDYWSSLTHTGLWAHERVLC